MIKRTIEDWDGVLTNPTRFTIMAALNSSDTVRSSTLRKAMGISQTLMSKHVSVLDSSGYIVVNKVVAGRNVITELEPTGKGRAAFADHLKHMREIVDSPLEDKV